MASAPDPESFYSRQRQEEARDKGHFVDIHDVTGLQPSEFNVLISDITHKTLESTISQDIGMDYLSKAEEPDANRVLESVTGYIRRLGHRALVPLVVNNDGEARWVFFIIDSSAPFTYLSVQVNGHSSHSESQVNIVVIREHTPNKYFRLVRFSVLRSQHPLPSVGVA